MCEYLGWEVIIIYTQPIVIIFWSKFDISCEMVGDSSTN